MKNAVKTILIMAVIFATAFTLAITLAACNKPTVEAVYISMDADTAQVQLGQTGQTIKFNAVVEGKNNPSQTVTWTVSSTADGTGEVANGTNISPSGTLNLSRTETAQSVFVRAASAQDAGKYDYVQINLASGTVTEGRQRRNRQREDTQTATDQTASQEIRPDTAEPVVISPPFATPNTNTATPASSTQPSTTATTQTTTPTTASGGFQMSGTTLTKYNGTSKSVTIPDGVTGIGDEAFEGSSGITSITIPSSVTSMNGDAFRYCQNLTSIIVDGKNSNFTSEGGILYNKAKTQIIRVPRGISGNITIPNSVTSIGDYAFNWCISITSVTFQATSKVTSIGNYAFSRSSLTSITIPNSVTSIGNKAFLQCDSLTSVNLSSGLTSIGVEAFYQCSKLTGSIIIPAGVTTISSQAFRETAITSVTLPSNLTRIDDGAFTGTRLTSINFPNKVQYIGDLAFQATAITSVTTPPGNCEFGWGVFPHSLTSITLRGGIAFADRLGRSPFLNNGDLTEKFLAGGPGTYTVTSFNQRGDPVWTKQ